MDFVDYSFELPVMDFDFDGEGDKKKKKPELDPAVKMEEHKKEEVSAVLRDFRDRAQDEKKNFYDNVDSEYWFAVGFQNREQKEAFLQSVGWLELGDKYLDGAEVAEKMGVTLPSPGPLRKTKINKKWEGLGIF